MCLHSGRGLGPTDHAVPRNRQVTGKAIGLSGPGGLTRLHRGLRLAACRPMWRPGSTARSPRAGLGSRADHQGGPCCGVLGI